MTCGRRKESVEVFNADVLLGEYLEDSVESALTVGDHYSDYVRYVQDLSRFRELECSAPRIVNDQSENAVALRICYAERADVDSRFKKNARDLADRADLVLGEN